MLGSKGNVGAMEWYHGNCNKPACKKNHTILTSRSSQKQLHLNKEHTVASLRGPSRGQVRSSVRSPVDPTCGCVDCREKPPALCQYHVAGVSNPQFAHHHCECERDCCGGRSAHRQRTSSVADVVNNNRHWSTTKSSVFSVSAGAQRNVAASSCTTQLPSMSKPAVRRSSSRDTTSNVGSTSTASKKQISLYGWYLMKPKGGDCCSSVPRIAIGGFKSPQMSTTEFVQTAPVEQRLERWRLRTNDGLEIRLMGMIDVKSSIASGLSSALVQYFIIGFPSSWMYLIRSMNWGASKGSTSVLPTPLASANRSGGLAEVGENCIRNSQEVLKANPLLRELTASLFTAPDEGTRRAALHRFSTITASGLHDGSWNPKSIPQCQLQQEQADMLRSDPDSCTRADRPVGDSEPHPQKLSGIRKCPHSEAASVGVEIASQDPDTSSPTQKSTVFGGCSPPGVSSTDFDNAGDHSESSTQSGKSEVVMDSRVSGPDDVNEAGFIHEMSGQTQEPIASGDCVVAGTREDVAGHVLEAVAPDKAAGDAHSEDLNLRTEDIAVTHMNAVEVDVPRTPLQTTQKLSWSGTDVGVGEKSTTQPALGHVSTPQKLGAWKSLRSGRHLPVIDKPIGEPTVYPGQKRKRMRSCKTVASVLGKNVVCTGELVESITDISDSLGDNAELDGQQEVPCMSLLANKKELGSETKMFVGNKPTMEPPTGALGTPQNLESRKKLRSGRCILVLGEPTSNRIVEPVQTLQNIKSQERLKTCKTVASVGRKSVIHAGELPGSVNKVCDSLEDCGEMDVQHQLPCTSLLSKRKQLRSEAKMFAADKPTLEPALHPLSTPPNLELRKKLRSGTCLSVIYAPTSDLVVKPLKTPKTIKTMKRQSCSTPVALVAGNPSREAAGDTKEMATDSEVLNANLDGSWMEPTELRDPAIKKRHRRVGTNKKSSRRKLQHEKGLPLEESKNSLNSVEDPEPDSKGGIHKSYGMVEIQSVPKSTAKKLTMSTSRNQPICPSVTHQQGTGVIQSAKRDGRYKTSILSSPQVANKSKENKSWHGEIEFAGMEDFQEQEDVDTNGDVFLKKDDQLCEESPEVIGSAGRVQHTKARNHDQGGRKSWSTTCSHTSCNSPMHRPTGALDKSQEMEEITAVHKNMNKKAGHCLKSTGWKGLDQIPAAKAASPRKRDSPPRNSILPPPLPSPRVQDKSKVIKAFGLKKSRSGRVLVPRLATWCNQSIKYDMDGGIIAISDGFPSEAESGTGYYNFKLPSSKSARVMQRKLNKAADTGSRKSVK